MNCLYISGTIPTFSWMDNSPYLIRNEKFFFGAWDRTILFAVCSQYIGDAMQVIFNFKYQKSSFEMAFSTNCALLHSQHSASHMTLFNCCVDDENNLPYTVNKHDGVSSGETQFWLHSVHKSLWPCDVATRNSPQRLWDWIKSQTRSVIRPKFVYLL